MTQSDAYASADWKAAVEGIVREHLDLEGAVLPILHAVQHQLGYISEEALALVAEGLHVTPSQLYAVATYYNEFRLGPQPAHRVSLCRGPACRAGGGAAVRRRFEELLGVEVGEATPDNRFALDTCGCLGICPHGPNVQVDHEVLGRVSVEDVEAIVAGRHPRVSTNGARPAGSPGREVQR